MTETHVYGTDLAEVSVWDTDGVRVWGPSGGGPGPSTTFPETTDALILQARPDSWAIIYNVAQDGTGDFITISEALNAEQSRRNAAQIQAVGPQDRALVRLHPGTYVEKIRSFPHWALVGVSGNRDDTIVAADMDATDNPTLSATQSLYVENVTFSSTYSATAVPPPGDTRATVWNSNAAPDTTIVFVNVRTISNNAVLNSCAMQPGHRNSYLFYKCRFETIPLPSQVKTPKGFQPFNVQTGLDVRYPNRAELGSDVVCIDCEAYTGSDNLVAGVTDLGSGTYDRVAWLGGGISFDSTWQTAAWFHSHYHSSTYDDFRVNSWCTPQVPFAGEAVAGVDLHWEEPSDLESWLPSGAVGPKARAAFYPQALSLVGTVPTAAPTGTFSMQAGRWYFVPVHVSEARTLAGFDLEVTAYSGSGGKLHAALWSCAPNLSAPKTWRSLGASSNLAVGVVSVARGTYRNVRMYPGDLLWVGVMADQACTVRAASQSSLYYQDSATVPASPVATAMPNGMAPAPVVRTGVV